MKVLKIGAVWCKECLVMKPMWDEIEKEMPDLVTEYFDADERPDILKEYGVKNIPSFIFLNKENVVIEALTGMQNKDNLVTLIKNNLSK